MSIQVFYINHFTVTQKFILELVIWMTYRCICGSSVRVTIPDAYADGVQAGGEVQDVGPDEESQQRGGRHLQH